MIAIVTSNKELRNNIYQTTVNAPAIAAEAVPGQFVHVRCGGVMLRRPLSICDVRDDLIVLLYQKKGEGTGWLSARTAGSPLDLMGPLGKGFRLPVSGKVCLAAGGMGIAPLFFLACRALSRQLQVMILIGGRSQKDILLAEELAGKGCQVHVVTEDGSCGSKGLVTAGLEAYLDSSAKPEAVYACGPLGMLEKVAEITLPRKIKTEVSLEARMACGVGACRGCVTAVKRHGEKYYENVCSAGPVFNAEEVIFHG